MQLEEHALQEVPAVAMIANGSILMVDPQSVFASDVIVQLRCIEKIGMPYFDQ